MKRYITLNAKTILIALSAISGLLLLIILAESYGAQKVRYDGYMETFYTAFFLGGLIFTSRIYHELHTPEKSYQYLSLPASTLEKLLSHWLISSVGYILASFLAMYIVAFVGGLLSAGLFQAGFQPIDLAPHRLLQAAGAYLVLQSIFLFGAVCFRGHNFLKTILGLFLFGIFISIFTSLAAKIILGDLFGQQLPHMEPGMKQIPAFFSETVPAIMKSVFWYVMAPFFLVVSYFKLKERQV
jgi:hypothetical protein